MHKHTPKKTIIEPGLQWDKPYMKIVTTKGDTIYCTHYKCVGGGGGGSGGSQKTKDKKEDL